ncbi:MAG: DMT family transporter [Candidatus Hodarchaeota archaeon]
MKSEPPLGGHYLKYLYALYVLMQIQENVNPAIKSAQNIIDFNALSAQRAAQLVLLFSNIIWGITPIFVEVVLGYLTPLQTTTFRFGLAVLVLSSVLLLHKGREAFSMLSGKTVIFLGWLDAWGYLAATIGQDMTTPGLATLLASFYIFIVPFLAWKIEGTRLNWRIVIIGLAGLMGIFLISFNGDWANFANSSILGILILMFAAFMWGFYTVITGKFLNISNTDEKQVDLLSFTYASLFHTFLALLILSMLTGELSLSIPLETIPYLVFLGFFPTIVALGLWNWAIARLGSVSTSFFQLLQVIVPFILEFILIQQIYSGWIYTGIFLILISTFGINENTGSSIEEIQDTTSPSMVSRETGFIDEKYKII